MENENLKQQAEWKTKKVRLLETLNTMNETIDKYLGFVKYQSIVTTWSLGFPLNSGLTLCSNNHITNPVKTKNAPVVHHMSGVNGTMNAQALFASSAFTGTTITRPDSVNGCVKSTYLLRFEKIVVSPTTASKFCEANWRN